jgi:hypothetical protein
VEKNNKWEDVSSYSQRDTKREVQSVQLTLPHGVRLVVTHLYYAPEDWFMHFYDEIKEHPLASRDLEGAKKEAVEKIKVYLQNILDGLK